MTPTTEEKVATLLERSEDHERRITRLEAQFWAIILLLVSTLATSAATLVRLGR